jgi:hypothetical protein
MLWFVSCFVLAPLRSGARSKKQTFWRGHISSARPEARFVIILKKIIRFLLCSLLASLAFSFFDCSATLLHVGYLLFVALPLVA